MSESGHNSALLEVEDLKVQFKLKRESLLSAQPILHAVDGVSFIIDRGKTLGLVGESGCGKSTSGLALLGLVTPSHGKLLFDGIDLSSLKAEQMFPIRKRMQIIFQDPYSSLNPRMLVKDIIKEPLDINTNLTLSEKNEKVDWLLNKVGLTLEQSNRYPHEFSGGQRQRIGIARALATDPEIIIADEPVSALDVSIQAEIINLMMDLQEELNLSIIFIAHDLSVVKHISSRVGVMYSGELVEIKDTGDIFDRPEHDYTKELLRAIPKPDPFGREERKKNRLSIV